MAWFKAPAGGSQPSESVPKRPRLLRRQFTPGGEIPAIGAAELQDGTFLECFAKRCVHEAIKAEGRPMHSREIKIGSVCTGSGADLVALNALENAFMAEGIGISFEVPFLCESDAQKRDGWLKHVAETLECSAQCCVFPDVCTLTEGATCCVHASNAEAAGRGDVCVPPTTLDGLIGGFSCKDLSPMNCNRATSGAALVKSIHSPGRTSDTLDCIFKLLDNSPPDFCFLENVEEMDAGEEPALDELLASIADRGFDVQTFKINTADVGLPQSRTRLFLL